MPSYRKRHIPSIGINRFDTPDKTVCGRTYDKWRQSLSYPRDENCKTCDRIYDDFRSRT
jgi:hypothetical protein